METNEYPTLYSVDSKGKTKVWTVMVLRNAIDQTAIIRKVYGRNGEKMQVNDKTIYKGKNLGKANETTAYEQAVSEATANWKKQTEKGYSEDINSVGALKNMMLPMLAQKFQQRKHNISYPAAAQPKLNGVRCLTKRISETEVNYTSKTGKSFNKFVSHLTPYILTLIDIGEVLDGELYHPDWSFQTINGHTKKLRPTSPQLQYWVYDLADEESTFDDRNLRLQDILLRNLPIIKRVTCTVITCEEDVKELHDRYVECGFEGCMIRNLNGLYRFGYRSADLQKYKEFEDKEFEIVGGEQGSGIEEGCVVFVCVTEDGSPFGVRPRGSREKRQRWFKNLDNIIGKKLTVRYQERSDDNIPIFPVGIAIRDYE